MPLLNTLNLLSQYGSQLIDNSITDDDLKQLLDPKNFKNHTTLPGKKDSYSDANYSTIEATLDFVQSIAPFLNEGVLEQLVTRCLGFEKAKRELIKDKILEKPQDYNGYMRDTVLEKYFLAYELTKTDSAGQQSTRFDPSGELYSIFNTQNNDDVVQTAFVRLKNTILDPSIRFFKHYCFNQKEVSTILVPYDSRFDYPHGINDLSAQLAIEISTLPDGDYKNQARTVLKTAHSLIGSNGKDTKIAKEAIDLTLKLITSEFPLAKYNEYIVNMQLGNKDKKVQNLGAVMLTLAKLALTVVKTVSFGHATKTIEQLQSNINNYRHRYVTGRPEKDISDDMGDLLGTHALRGNRG